MISLTAFDSYVDNFGLLVQKDGDGGDSAQREGMLAAGASILFQEQLISPKDYFSKTLRVLNRVDDLVSPEGLLRRHADAGRWYGQWNRGSRDQSHIIIGLALIGARSAFYRLFRAHARRLFMWTTNTRSNGFPGSLQLPDFTGIGFLGLWIRGAAYLGDASKWWKPVLWLCDLSLVANSLIRVYVHGHNKDNSDSLNHVQSLALAHYSMPTFVSAYAAKLMRKMPKKYDLTPNAPNAVQQEFNDYFGSNNGIAPMADLWAPIIEKVVYDR